MFCIQTLWYDDLTIGHSLHAAICEWRNPIILSKCAQYDSTFVVEERSFLVRTILTSRWEWGRWRNHSASNTPLAVIGSYSSIETTKCRWWHFFGRISDHGEAGWMAVIIGRTNTGSVLKDKPRISVPCGGRGTQKTKQSSGWMGRSIQAKSDGEISRWGASVSGLPGLVELGKWGRTCSAGESGTLESRKQLPKSVADTN